MTARHGLARGEEEEKRSARLASVCRRAIVHAGVEHSSITEEEEERRRRGLVGAERREVESGRWRKGRWKGRGGREGGRGGRKGSE